jgi:hypothetical protein
MPSRKRLQDVARSLAVSFASMLNDESLEGLVRSARRGAATELRCDLLTGRIAPARPLAAEVQDALAHYVQRFPELVQRSQSDIALVSAAELVVAVDPAARRGPRGTDPETRYTCTVRITDDRGQLHEYALSGWWSAQPPDDD